MFELVLALLFAIASAPLAFWWCCCSGCKGPYCDTNAAHGTIPTKMTTGGACRGPRPTQATITISGITNGSGGNSCTNCNIINGTWVATLAYYPGTGCIWASPPTAMSDGNPACDIFYFVVSIHCTGLAQQAAFGTPLGRAQVLAALTVHDPSDGQAIWQNFSKSSPANCDSLGVLTMAFGINNMIQRCTAAGATITVQLT